ncbi:M23 family metallopeptidase [Lysinibacillus sp. 54212]|uniref:M23 family metallopeptidase n=1 Tax=Lysinibacillus sp. 54212 TaxID=3119829 RepID=UPI002FCAAB6F
MSSKGNAKVGYTKSLIKRHKAKGIKAAFIAILLSSVTFNLAFAKETEDKEEFSKVYHIYNGEEYIGAVSDQEAVQQLLGEKAQEASHKYTDFTVDVGSQVKVIPEQVFTVAVNNEETLAKLNDTLVVEAAAHALVINEKPVAYLKNEADYAETMNLLKLKYVTQQELDALNASNTTEQAPLSENNQTRIVEISLAEEVSGEATSINPDQIITPAQAVELLQTGALEKQVYKVQEGDVLGSIAKAHGLKLAQLLALNPSITETTVLKIGQEINVTVNKPLVTVSVVKEAFRVEEIPFQKITQKDESMMKGESKVTQEGKNGQREKLHKITTINGKVTDDEVISEVITAEPVDNIEVVGTKVILSHGTGSFAWPAVGGYISSKVGSRWGRHHNGIDIARPSDYTIKATDNGVVTFAGYDGTFGNKVVINHNNGYETIYAHLSSISVSVGQVVGQGAKLGVMGSTGRSTGVHLHFEVYKNGSLINPLSVLN